MSEEHAHTFRLDRVELECSCGVRQIHAVVHGAEMWHQQLSDYAADRSVFERIERLQAERDDAREDAAHWKSHADLYVRELNKLGWTGFRAL